MLRQLRVRDQLTYHNWIWQDKTFCAVKIAHIFFQLKAVILSDCSAIVPSFGIFLFGSFDLFAPNNALGYFLHCKTGFYITRKRSLVMQTYVLFLWRCVGRILSNYSHCFLFS